MMMTVLASAALASALPDTEQCRAVADDPAAALAYSSGLQGYAYGYPIVDLLQQKHRETRPSPDRLGTWAPVNRITTYPGLLTPGTQGNLRAPNVDTLYVNAWFDLSGGPVLLDVPDFAERYYTLGFFDLYGKPTQLGTRTNEGEARRYALVSPSGGEIPEGYEPVPLATGQGAGAA